MTIYVTVAQVSEADEWYYWYGETYNMVSVKRVGSQYPYSTLQGAYNLIIDVDTAKVVSSFETVSSAEISYWQVMPTLVPPQAEVGRVLVARDIDDGQGQSYFTDPNYRMFYTRLGPPVEPTRLRHVAIGEQVLVDLTPQGMLAGVWMLDLPPEIGQKHAAQPNG